MSIKKYIPGSTEAIKILVVVIVVGALGGIAMGQSFIKTKILGRF